MWNDINPNTPMERMLYAETERIFRAYGNHPSFILLSAMNEAHGRWKDCLPQWVASCRIADPRRLYTPNTGWSIIDAPGPVEGADYLSVARIGLNPLRGQSAWFGRDYGRSLRGVNVPVVSHELGQWCAYPDYSVIKKFDGYMRPGNYEIFRDSLAAHGLANKDKDFAWASGRFQLACYKEEIEANLRTPGLAGFQLLDLHDYVGQGSAFVGLLDTFWEEKGYVTAQEFRKFCQPTVPLARLPQSSVYHERPFEVDVEVANYGSRAWSNAPSGWAIENARNEIVSSGLWGKKPLPIGKNTSLGQVKADLSKLPAPGEYRLVVDVAESAGGPYASHPPFPQNDWNVLALPVANFHFSSGKRPHHQFLGRSRNQARHRQKSFVPAAQRRSRLVEPAARRRADLLEPPDESRAGPGCSACGATRSIPPSRNFRPKPTATGNGRRSSAAFAP